MGNPHPPLTIILPPHAKALARGDPGAVLAKSRVFFADAQGVVDPRQKPRRLQGAISDRTTPTGFGSGAHLDTQSAIRTNRHNGLVGNVDGQPTSKTIWCRHLAMWYLHARMAHHALPDPKPPFSFDPVLDIAEIEKLDHDLLEAQYDALEEAGPSVVFDQTHIPDMLITACDGIQPGEHRYFGVGADGWPEGHMLSLEISCKRVPHGNGFRMEYGINLYDPNKTATHERLVVEDPSMLLNMGLDRWFSVGEIGQLYPLQPSGPVATEEPLMLFGDLESPAPERLRNHMAVAFFTSKLAGVDVHALIDYLSGHQPDPAKRGVLVATALQEAAQCNWTAFNAGAGECASVVACINAILELPAEVQGSRDKLDAIESCTGGNKGTLAELLLKGRPEAHEVLATVLAEPTLAPVHKEILAMARIDGRPSLHLLCAAEHGGGGLDAYGPVYQQVLSIATAAIDSGLKGRLIASAHSLPVSAGPDAPPTLQAQAPIEASIEVARSSNDDSSNSDSASDSDSDSDLDNRIAPGPTTTAAGEALRHGNYALAAAFVTAILDCQGTAQEKQTLMGAVGVSVREVMDAIELSVNAGISSESESEWALQTLTRLARETAPEAPSGNV